jgi:hypothetical protein
MSFNDKMASITELILRAVLSFPDLDFAYKGATSAG